MPGSFRVTIPTQLVLQAMLQAPDGEFYGVEIGRAAGLVSGTVHPILARLEAQRWLQSRWEDVDPSVAGRAARRYYRLTGEGATAARQILAERAHARAAWLKPAPDSP